MQSLQPTHQVGARCKGLESTPSTSCTATWIPTSRGCERTPHVRRPRWSRPLGRPVPVCRRPLSSSAAGLYRRAPFEDHALNGATTSQGPNIPASHLGRSVYSAVTDSSGPRVRYDVSVCADILAQVGSKSQDAPVRSKDTAFTTSYDDMGAPCVVSGQVEASRARVMWSRRKLDVKDRLPRARRASASATARMAPETATTPDVLQHDFMLHSPPDERFESAAE